MADFPHISFPGRTESLPYSGFGRKINSNAPRENRQGHGAKIRTSMEESVQEFTGGDEDYDFVYVEFDSAIDFELDLDKFEDAEGNFRLAFCRELVKKDDQQEKILYRAAVYLNKKAVGVFLNKVEQYINEDTAGGNPRNASLVSNIEEIRAATLESFWQEKDYNFPAENENVWWEVWIEKAGRSFEETKLSLSEGEIEVNPRTLNFPEHIVFLVKGTPAMLGNQLLYLDNLAELRKPIETTEFFANLDKEWEEEFIDELKQRVINRIGEEPVSVCLLDTGVNRENPLLKELIPEGNLDAVNPAWTKADSLRHGHGTPMAGLILYGDLTGPLNSGDQITVSVNLESIKIKDVRENDPELYGQITLEAIATGEIMYPENKRVVCMAITTSDKGYCGKPSSWSAAIDQQLFGTLEERNDKTLFFVSSGNLFLNKRLEYPLSNDDFSIQDPAQSCNAITVGAYTELDRLDVEEFPGAELLAPRGGMSPCNSTSIGWDNPWPRKPDIVLEGGNAGILNNELLDVESLKLLSTGVGGIGRSWLTTMADTSASTALASKMAAELYAEYPNLRPETIRALLIHSADWNEEMLGNRPLEELSSNEKKQLLSRVGYGIPNLGKARYSTKNYLTLIAERTLTPYKKEKSVVKTNEFHLFDLPWPKDILTELAELNVTLKVTLSYFIEPNPGSKVYAHASSYQSHGLRFGMIDRNESTDAFKARISKVLREEQEDYAAEGNENWILGSRVRDKGSLHKDIWKGAAADLALRNKIAVFPTVGWWKNRKKLERYNLHVQYSLIVSIETEPSEVDIYTPIYNEINIPIEIES